MKPFLLLTLLLLLNLPAAAAAPRLLVVADEFPAMEYMASRLRADGGFESQIVWQTNLPTSLTEFHAAIVYIHRRLDPQPERRLIDYAEAGGRLVLLHHSISSGKRTNAFWFPFLGVKLPTGELAAGGYKWLEPATLQVVNLAPSHFITTHEVPWPGRVAWAPPGGPKATLPGVVFHESEVYLNHQLEGPRTLLLGFRFEDPKTGEVFCQSTAGWLRPAGKGWLFYFMPGHSQRDFEAPTYQKLLLNALTWKP